MTDRPPRRRTGAVGSQLQKARTHANLSHSELSHQSGVPVTQIVDIESGNDDDCTLSTLEQLASVLDIEFLVGKSSAD